MTQLPRLWRLVRLEIWRQILGWSGAWWFLVTLVVGQAVAPLLGMFVWLNVPSAGPQIGAYYLAVLTVALLTASFENHTFGNSIYSGEVATALLRPQPPIIRPIGENLAIRLWMVALGVPLILLTAIGVRADFSLLSLALAVPAVLIAAALRFLFTWTLAMAAFWTERVHAVVAFGTALIMLLGGSAAPNGLLPEPLRTIAQLLPFRGMLGFPAELATGVLGWSEIVSGYTVAILWLAILGVCAIGGWRVGIRRYSTVGA